MKSIGVVGAGIAGLQLGLFLQQHNIEATLYSDRSSEQILAGGVPNFVVRFDRTRQYERALGVDFWNFDDFGVRGVQMHVGVQPAIQWQGVLKQPASAVDMRLYQSRLLDEFARRGGRVVVGEVGIGEVAHLAASHDLMVVASGRGNLTKLFPRLPERSPFAQPQRRLTGAFYRGINFPDPLGVVYTISPGNGEIFQAPFHTLSGRVCSILIEGVPGQAFDPIMEIRYNDDPRRFEKTVLALLREHAPAIYSLVDPNEFAVTRSQDVLQGAITPTARRGYACLESGKFVLALGDAHILNDPVLGQGANLAARCAWLLGKALLDEQIFDESFCGDVERRLWEAGRAATLWTNLMLQPPPPHAVAVLAAAAQNQAIADEITENFNEPERNWQIFGNPQGAQHFLERHAKVHERHGAVAMMPSRSVTGDLH